jgi:antitoxin (DNA-binding transcriptional repressor) of toxin-antitoxin stability system
MAIKAGIRELKSRLSAYLRMVKSGQTVIITERGKVIGYLSCGAFAGRADAGARNSWPAQTG